MAGTRGEDAPVEGTDLMERVLEREHLRRALRQVRRHRGAPGIDGMTVDGLVAHLTAQWPAIRSSLVDGTDTPQPVRRVESPKAGGGTRHLGGPVVLDRVVEQALARRGDTRNGTRRVRSGATAFGRGAALTRRWHTRRRTIRDGDAWIADRELETCFDRVNHDVLLSRVRARGRDRRVVQLIHRVLKAGAFTLEGVVEPTAEGTPQGSPRSPLLANRRLDDLDTELETRGHRFVR